MVKETLEMAKIKKASNTTKRKARFKKELESEWGKTAYLINQDLHSPYPERDCEKLKKASCKCAVMPSIRSEYSMRDYFNVWSSCKNAEKILRSN